MDDIKVWLYVIIGVIYFVVRSLRNKNPENKPPSRSGPAPGQPQSQQRPNRPKSFEELLREFTEPPREEEEEEVEEAEAEYRPARRAYDSVLDEGSRQFSDDESKRIYEESVRMVQGSETAVEPITRESGSKFAVYSQKDEENPLAKEIRETLMNPDGAKKAIILGEILNRKY